MSSQVSLESVGSSTASLPRAGAKLRVTTYADFEALPCAYPRLFKEHTARSFYHSLPWFRNFSRNALDVEDQIRIYGVELEDATPIAVLPTRYTAQPAKRLGTKTLFSLANYYSSLYGPLLDPEVDSQEVLQELARFICAETPRWDMVNLRYLDRDSPVFEALVRAFRSAGMVVQTYFCFGNWYLQVNGRSYREYFDSLRSSVRNIAASKNKKLERSGQVRVEIITGGSDLESAIHTYEQVYASSWKVQEPYPCFVPGLIRTCAENGWLRLGLAYVNEQPAAAQLWVVHDGIASIYKIAYDRKFSDLSVGTYLTTRLLQQVIDVERVREVDYLSGDDRYKQDWMSHRRERWGILALNPRTVMGSLAIIRHVGGRAVRTAMRVLLRRPLQAETSAAQGKTGLRTSAGR